MRAGRRVILLVPAAAFLLPAVAACGGGADLIVGATTSLDDTGILAELTSAFEDESGYDVAAVTPIVAGSGQVLELARRGEVDVVITHSPEAEAQLIAEGDGIDRRPVMQNFFLIAGPPDDPAGIAEAESPVAALKLIAQGEHAFISRGDGSGTHQRERTLWKEAGIDPSGSSWYQESATGQGQNLLIASDKGAYTLVDSATFRAFRERLSLAPYAVDAEAPNVYSVIRVNPEKHGGVNEEAARAFADFLTSALGQGVIQRFGLEEYGESLFIPVSPVAPVTVTPTDTTPRSP